MKVANLINNINALTNNIVSDGVLIDYINVLEDMIFREVIREFRIKWIDVKGEDNIVFPFSKFQIKNATIYSDDKSKRIQDINFIDDNLNIDIYSDVEQEDEGFSIANKWGDCSVKVVYRYTPKLKTMERAEEDDLDITRYGLTWYSIYEHYLKAMSFFAVEEYSQYNNETILYNEDVTRLKKYIFDNYHNETIKRVESRWK